jgi:hypothetical protein
MLLFAVQGPPAPAKHHKQSLESNPTTKGTRAPSQVSRQSPLILIPPLSSSGTRCPLRCAFLDPAPQHCRRQNPERASPLSVVCRARVNSADVNVAVVWKLNLLARWLADHSILGSSQGIHLLVVGLEDLEPVVQMVAKGIVVEGPVAASSIKIGFRDSAFFLYIRVKTHSI